jgi:hypothetical protein
MSVVPYFRRVFTEYVVYNSFFINGCGSESCVEQRPGICTSTLVYSCRQHHGVAHVHPSADLHVRHSKKGTTICK